MDARTLSFPADLSETSDMCDDRCRTEGYSSAFGTFAEAEGSKDLPFNPNLPCTRSRSHVLADLGGRREHITSFVQTLLLAGACSSNVALGLPVGCLTGLWSA